LLSGKYLVGIIAQGAFVWLVIKNFIREMEKSVLDCINAVKCDEIEFG